MGTWWVHSLVQEGRIVELISWIFWVILSITLHELAHGWVALWQGDNTPRLMGRMSANPVVHMGAWSLLIFAIIGIAWGVMPTDPSKYRWRRRGRIVVAGAGPAMNIVIALAALALLVIWLAVGPRGTDPYTNIAAFLWTGGWLNFALAGFNLLPVPPLDGSQILAGLSFRLYRLYEHPNAQMAGFILVLVLFLTGAWSIFFVGAWLIAIVIVTVPGELIGNPPITEVLPMFA